MLIVYNIVTILIGCYIFFALVLAVYRKKEGALLVIVGFIIYAFTVLNDILFYQERVGISDIYPIGVFAFVLSQSYLLSRRIANAYATIEQMSDKLFTMNKLKDEFLAHASHELLTPLSGIIGLAEAMAETSATVLTDKDKTNLSLIISSARRLTGLVRDILDFSKLKYKDITLQKKPVDIHQVVEKVLSFCQPLIIHKDLELRMELPADLPLVEAENIVSNKFYTISYIMR